MSSADQSSNPTSRDASDRLAAGAGATGDREPTAVNVASGGCAGGDPLLAARQAAIARRSAYDRETAEALRLWIVLSRAYAAVQAHASADVARYGLSLAEFGALEALYHKGPLLVGDLQRGILMSSGGMTFLVDRLETRGFVARQGCPQDRRAVWVALTPEGSHLMDEIFPVHAERVRAAVAGVPPDERRALTDALKRLGCPAADAARALGLDPSTASAGSARATRRGRRRATPAPPTNPR